MAIAFLFFFKFRLPSVFTAAQASLAERGLWSAQAQQLQSVGLRAPQRVGSYFPNQALNPSPLYYKADS